MAGDMRLAKFAVELIVGDYLFVETAERAFPIVRIGPATCPGTILVTVETSVGTFWTMPLDHDESCVVEVLS